MGGGVLQWLWWCGCYVFWVKESGTEGGLTPYLTTYNKHGLSLCVGLGSGVMGWVDLESGIGFGLV